MGRRVLKFHGSRHQATEMLLPWFVNGTLEGEELALVEQHLESCARCQREVDALRELQAAYMGTEMLPDAAASFQELRRQLDGSRTAWRPAALFRRLSQSWWQSPTWAQWVLAAQLGVIVLLGSLVVLGSGSDTLYRTLAAADAPRHAAGSLVVVFDPRVTEAELRQIVRRVGAQVVDGPTEAGAYVLQLPPERQTVAVATLRAERAVALVETLGQGSER